MNESAEVVQGITFATDDGKIYVPLDEMEQRLHFQLANNENRMLMRKLSDGALLMSLKEITYKDLVVSHADASTNSE